MFLNQQPLYKLFKEVAPVKVGVIEKRYVNKMKYYYCYLIKPLKIIQEAETLVTSMENISWKNDKYKLLKWRPN